MCGIAGLISLSENEIPELDRDLRLMSNLLSHRGPDGFGYWKNANKNVGLAHRRLAIIDLAETAGQPMRGENGTVITYNGEVYNFP